MKDIVFSRLFYAYGFLPFLYLIKEFEDNEEYEKCELIFKSLRKEISHLSIDLPASFSKGAIDIFLNQFKDSPNKGEIAMENIPSYMDEIRYQLNLES